MKIKNLQFKHEWSSHLIIETAEGTTRSTTRSTLRSTTRIFMFRFNPHHRHGINSFESNILSIINNFKENVYPRLVEKFEEDKRVLDDFNRIFNEIKSQHDTDLKSIKEEFGKTHKIVSILERDVEKQIKTKFEKKSRNKINYKFFNQFY
ncbi:hypothetical protein ACTA71_000395 [Dictyostelium dimigraforme]